MPPLVNLTKSVRQQSVKPRAAPCGVGAEPQQGSEPTRRPCSHRRKEQRGLCVSCHFTRWLPAPSPPPGQATVLAAVRACHTPQTNTLLCAEGVYALQTVLYSESHGAEVRLGPYYVELGPEATSVFLNASSGLRGPMCAFGGSPTDLRSKPCTWGLGTRPHALGVHILTSPHATQKQTISKAPTQHPGRALLRDKTLNF